MRKYWNTIFGLECKRSIWIVQEELDKEKVIIVNNKRLLVRLPQKINRDVVLRLRGRGKIRENKTGDLLLHIWLNKGDDIQKSLWLSETSARNGVDKVLVLNEKKTTIVIPPQSYHGLTIRYKGLGEKLDYSWRAPFLRRKRGNLLVRLIVYPDKIVPRYGSFEMLSTEDMALEGWVYRKIDQVIHKIGKDNFPVCPIQADTVANSFNDLGWQGIFRDLVRHLRLTHLKIELAKSNSISRPGSCQRNASVDNNNTITYSYLITINDQFLDNPFSIAAILAHELSHVIYSEKIEDGPKTVGMRIKSDEGTLDEERSVDLLAFMFKIGEFQLRVARDKRLTLGYFDQVIFERIQIIVSKKLDPVGS